MTAFFGDYENVSESDANSLRSVLESLVEENRITRKKISTKSGMKTYYKGQ